MEYMGFAGYTGYSDLTQINNQESDHEFCKKSDIESDIESDIDHDFFSFLTRSPHDPKPQKNGGK